MLCRCEGGDFPPEAISATVLGIASPSFDYAANVRRLRSGRLAMTMD